MLTRGPLLPQVVIDVFGERITELMQLLVHFADCLKFIHVPTCDTIGTEMHGWQSCLLEFFVRQCSIEVCFLVVCLLLAFYAIH